MMTGPQHYAEAERYLASVADTPSRHVVEARIALAQVHATLALAAATAALASTGPVISQVAANHAHWSEVVPT